MGGARPLIVEPYYRERIVTARRPHYCDRGDGISQGERYLLVTEYPGHDAGVADAAGRPWRWKLCARHSHGRIA